MGKLIGQPRPVTERAATWLRDVDPDSSNPRAVALATAALMWPVWQRLERRGLVRSPLLLEEEAGLPPETDLPPWRTHVAERYVWLALNADLFIRQSGPRAQPSQIKEHIDRLNAALTFVKREADWIAANVADGDVSLKLAKLTAFPRVFVPLRRMPERERPIIRFLSEAMQELTGRTYDAHVAAAASIVLDKDVDSKRVEKIRKLPKSDPESPEPISPENGEN
jgi:hypothetical protein